MAKRKDAHPDVEFKVIGRGGRAHSFSDFDEAAAFAVRGSLEDGVWRGLSVIVHSEDGAYWWGGSDAVDAYRSNPKAQVFEKLNVKVNREGMIA